MEVNIARLDAFYAFRGKSIKLVDGDFKVDLYIDASGSPTDEKMVDWQVCDNTCIVFWEYDGRALSDVVMISIIEDTSERPSKKRKVRIKL
tara:strand:- start:893 stop:1165 length:273 start_codon:yes stop_codon:yes gene_type:complete